MTRPSPSETAETSASSADSSGAPAGSATPEGTKLAYGESAVVVLDDEKPGELVQLTVNAPRAGTPEELASLQVQGLKGDEAIYYLDLAITNVSAAPTGGDYNPSTTSQLLALQPDQSPATPVIKFSTFDPCEIERRRTTPSAGASRPARSGDHGWPADEHVQSSRR